MDVPKRLLVGTLVMGAALAYYVRKRSAETGEGCLHIVCGLPEDVRRWVDRTKDRATRALEEGKTAARERDAELTRELQAASASSDY